MSSLNENVIKIPSADPRYYFMVRADQMTDFLVLREIWSENVYEVFDGDLVDTKVVLDVGANIGAFSIYMHSLQPDVKVYAFEPEPHNLELLNENITLNNLHNNIFIKPFALGATNGIVQISDGGGGSRIGDQGASVPIQTLQSFLDDNKKNFEFIDVLKVDVEGAEYDVVLPLSKATMNLIRFVVVEFDNHAEKGKFGELVTKLAQTHQLKIVGNEDIGGYIYGHRY